MYDPNGDSGNGIVEYYIDGGLVGSNTRAEVEDETINHFGFGKASSPVSDGHYSWARFETGRNIVPEPSTIAMLGGLVCLSLLMWRRWR